MVGPGIVDQRLTVSERVDFRPVLVLPENLMYLRMLATSVALAGVLVAYAWNSDPVIGISAERVPLRFLMFTTTAESPPPEEMVAESEDYDEEVPLKEEEEAEPIKWAGPKEIEVLPGTLDGPFVRSNRMDRKMARVIFAHTSHWVLSLDGQVDVEIRYRGYSKARAKKTMRTFEAATGWLLGDWGRHRKLNGDCKVRHLTIYDLSETQINDRDLMDFGKWDTWSFKRISGLYDTTVTSSNHGTMFLTAARQDDPDGLGRRSRIRVIAHETAHYWQDRSCRMSPVKKAEKMAKEFGRVFHLR